MAGSRIYTDSEQVDITMLEYEEEPYIGLELDINKKKDYIGTVSHIYDNTSNAEEQVYVLTNNGNPNRAAVPYSASQADRNKVDDVTVLMKGSNTEVDTKKNTHDTITDWLGTDFPTAVHILGVKGATKYGQEHLRKNVYSMVSSKTREVLDNVDKSVNNFVGDVVGTFNKDAAKSTKHFLNNASNNPVSRFIKNAVSQGAGINAAYTASGLTTDLTRGASRMLNHVTTFPPEQFKAAARHLKEVIKKYPNAKIDLSGHSLGSMDIQYALACLTEEELTHIRSVRLHNGPNIYSQLTKEQQKRLDSVKYKIVNSIDHKDIVSLGYPQSGSEGAVGIVQHVKTKELGDIGNQHMMKGYIYNKDGSFQLAKGTEKQTIIDRIKAKMVLFQAHKKKLSAGGLSGHEQIFLDSEQATATASGLTEAAKQGQEKIQSIKDGAVKEAEEVYASLREVPFGFILTPDEVAQAYAEAGIDRSSTVDKVSQSLQKKEDKASELVTNFSELEGKIQAGIEQELSADAQLAGEFKEWSE
ncbi:Mbeg1-like protein [Streptococcus oricebi]|uniref:DUF2974 domain-containing protein n=1 Tax=Streptococcus oricebi TaxID=1547447 RepID=A0ABS5B0Z9_9STRE|nr:Mbeg1-like protein [Streptococcus oricebi]MBP2622430.1 hypothetical protein [Streptococcus oricebi]